jgi:hypothetical protein
MGYFLLTITFITIKIVTTHLKIVKNAYTLQNYQKKQQHCPRKEIELYYAGR